MRNQAFIVAATGVVALSMSGCSNDSGTNTASPSPSVSPTTNAVASGTPSPPGKASFPSPMVSPSPEGVAPPPGLTGATNPEDRVKQLETGLAPLTTKKPGSLKLGLSSDPFAFLPPQLIQEGDTAKGDTPKKDVKFSALKIPQLPLLPTNARPPQIGGTKLTGADVGEIRLTPLAQNVVNEFRTFNSLLDDTTTYSDYNKDLEILREIIYGKKEDNEVSSKNSPRRLLLLTNRPLFRRLEKALAEY
ncbi:MAG: hypothetical protein ACRCT1_14195, partial [Microcoleaceae cyanobacterium]